MSYQTSELATAAVQQVKQMQQRARKFAEEHELHKKTNMYIDTAAVMKKTNNINERLTSTVDEWVVQPYESVKTTANIKYVDASNNVIGTVECVKAKANTTYNDASETVTGTYTGASNKLTETCENVKTYVVDAKSSAKVKLSESKARLGTATEKLQQGMDVDYLRTEANAMLQRRRSDFVRAKDGAVEKLTAQCQVMETTGRRYLEKMCAFAMVFVAWIMAKMSRLMMSMVALARTKGAMARATIEDSKVQEKVPTKVLEVGAKLMTVIMEKWSLIWEKMVVETRKRTDTPRVMQKIDEMYSSWVEWAHKVLAEKKKEK